MTTAVILDTGPLVSFLVHGSTQAAWVTTQWRRLRPPLLTCEPVLTEAAFLLKRDGNRANALFELLERGVLKIGLRMDEQRSDLQRLMQRYEDRPMSLADACLVRMSELYGRSTVFTLDGDFNVYRRHGNKVIPVLMPERWKSITTKQ